MNDPRQRGWDDVNGIVIGGDYVAWRIAYNDVPQSQKDYAINDGDAIEAGKALVAKLKVECCGYPHYLYPDSTKWTVQIYE